MGTINYNSINQGSKLYKKREYSRGLEPYLCNKCNKVWQFTEGYIFQEYLIGFPTYGCTRSTCRSCANNNHAVYKERTKQN